MVARQGMTAERSVGAIAKANLVQGRGACSSVCRHLKRVRAEGVDLRRSSGVYSPHEFGLFVIALRRNSIAGLFRSILCFEQMLKSCSGVGTGMFLTYVENIRSRTDDEIYLNVC